jgi:tryptophan 2,3-dioxygenase
VRRTGKHVLPEHLLASLSELRRRHAARDPFLDAFLDCILDKYDGRYCNRTYLALPLLERLLEDPDCGLDPHRMSALLMADVVRFELRAADAPGAGPRDDRPDAATLRKRLRHALRFVFACLGSDGFADPTFGTEALVDDELPEPPAGPAGKWFAMTAQPLSVRHDEYFFIRALQSHEMVFTVLAAEVRAATTAMRAGCVQECVARVEHANEVFERAAMLFRVVATMRAEAFHDFRRFTQGASAIQSEQYKRFEAACGAPTPARLRSEAFADVPAVKAAVDSGQDSLSDAYLDARRQGRLGQRDRDVLGRALGALEDSHQRWKSAHHTLAARMLGNAPGSGYTEGVPYLERCLSNRLFWRLAA